jgi:4-hydroxythreonine-4-phosphate dehydrogenase
MERPRIGITLGDPAGIGPEIIVRALAEGSLYEICRPFVIGDNSVVRKAMECCRLDLAVNIVNDPEDGLYRRGSIDLMDMENVDSTRLETGMIQALGGKASYEFIERAVELCMDNGLDAIATAPINKESLKLAGVKYIGHTEILAGLAGIADPLTMFEVGRLRIFFLTRHVSLRRACDMVTEERLLDYIGRCSDALARLGVADGTMAVAGLNPHSGEHGLFGDEEMVSIIPAIEKARSLGYRVEGPIGADSVFHLALQGKYNSVLSLYHDQGHIAAKTYDFERTISLTIGLPFLRTSVDHGTAFDIAGKGMASPVSMIEAVRTAAKYAPMYSRARKTCNPPEVDCQGEF